jgi:anti-sigma factor RsiW
VNSPDLHLPDAALPDERLEAWLDGDLPPDEADAVATRVASDALWAEAADTARHLRRTLAAAPRHTAPPGFADAVLARLHHRPDRAAMPRRARTMPRWLRFAAPVVLAFLVVLATRLPHASTAPSPEEVAEARRQVEYALGLLSNIGAKTGERTAEALAPLAPLDTLGR